MDNPPVVLSELPRSLTVSDTVRGLMDASVSENTRRAYRSALNKFGDWLSGAPVTDEAIADYLAGLHEAGKSPQTCAQVVAALKFAAKLHGMTPPIGPVTNRVLTGIRRSGRGRGRGQVQGVSFSQSDAAASFAVTGGSLADSRDAAIIAVASDGLLRASEVAALQVDDITCQPDGSGTVTIRSSKTDQEGRGAELYLGAITVGRIKAWLEKAGIREGPLFRRVFLKGSRVGDRKNERVQRPGDHQETMRRHRHRGAGLGPLAARGRGAVPGRRRGFLAGNADRRALGIAADARPLRSGSAGGQGSRGANQVREGLMMKRVTYSTGVSFTPPFSWEKTLHFCPGHHLEPFLFPGGRHGPHNPPFGQVPQPICDVRAGGQTGLVVDCKTRLRVEDQAHLDQTAHDQAPMVGFLANVAVQTEVNVAIGVEYTLDSSALLLSAYRFGPGGLIDKPEVRGQQFRIQTHGALVQCPRKVLEE